MQFSIAVILLILGTFSFCGGLARLLRFNRTVEQSQEFFVSEALALERTRTEAVLDIADSLVVLVGGLLLATMAAVWR